jgi:PII-like signaling protein
MMSFSQTKVRLSVRRCMATLACILIASGMALGLAGCRETAVIGEIDPAAPVALIRFEALEEGINGVVYRRINNFEAFLGASRVPVIVVFYDQQDPQNSLVIPRLEQMADDYRDRLQIVWINAETNKSIAALFSVEKLPQFTVVSGAVLKRSLIGFGDQGSIRLEELIRPYLS